MPARCAADRASAICVAIDSASAAGSDVALRFGAREAIGERLALEKLHDEERRALVLADVVKRADVRMRQLRDDTRFPAEAFTKLGIGGETFGENFDRDRSLESRIAGAIDVSHPA